MSRRQLLRWSVGASGALFASTALLAALAFARPRRRGGRRAIVEASAVPMGGVYYFTYPGPGDHAILLQLRSGRFVAYGGKCTHLSCGLNVRILLMSVQLWLTTWQVRRRR